MIEINKPLVSAIIPCFNSSKWILDAINSIKSQTYNNIEIIVVDDGSTDNTVEIIYEIDSKILVILQENAGPGVARNNGIKYANGKYIAFLDSDDMWKRDKIEKQVRYMEDNCDVIMSFSNVDLINSEGRFIKKRNNIVPPHNQHKLVKKIFKGKILMNTPTIMVVKEFINQYGGFNENLKMREDHLFILKCLRYGKIRHFRESLVQRRVSSNSMSKNIDVGKLYDLYYPFIFESQILFPFLKRHEGYLYSKTEMMFVRHYWKKGNFTSAKSRVIKAIKMCPIIIINYLYFALILLRIPYGIYTRTKRIIR